MRVIPTGGRDITDAVVASHDIPFGEAERIKRAIGISGRQLSPEAQPIGATIAAATHEQLMSVRNTISYFATARPNTPIQRVVLSGGGGELPGIREAFAELTRLPVTTADPGSRVNVARSARIDGNGWPDSLSVAVGLAVGSTA
jgi:type IV pilus assembly protein PilM